MEQGSGPLDAAVLRLVPFNLLLAVLALLGVAVVGAAYVMRTATIVRREREVAARLKVGPDGIVAGASSFTLPGDPRRAVLLLHGFGDTPQTLAYLANHLNTAGWTVRAPLLPGHGRLLRELVKGRAGAWIACAREELAALRTAHEHVTLVGLSMGGAIAAIIAAETPSPPAIVLLAPYLSMPRRIRLAAATYQIWAPLVPYVSGRGEASVRDERERKRSLSPGVTTGRLLRELHKITLRAQDALPRIVSPTLVIHSREDNRIPAEVAARNFERLGAPVRRLVWREKTGHVITVDFGREEVFTLVDEWLSAHTPAQGAAARVPHDRSLSH